MKNKIVSLENEDIKIKINLPIQKTYILKEFTEDDEIHRNIVETESILQNLNNADAMEFSKWIREKAYLKFNGKLPDFPIYNNFIYWCNLGINIGSEQNKLRPVLIVKTSKNSTICTILPLTSKRLQDNLWFHIDLNDINSTVLVEQLSVVSKIRITSPYRKNGKLVTISKCEWNKIEEQLNKLYRLRPLKIE